MWIASHTVNKGTGESDRYPSHCVTATGASKLCDYCGDQSCLELQTQVLEKCTGTRPLYDTIHTVDTGTGGSDWYPGHCVIVTEASNPCVYCGDMSCQYLSTQVLTGTWDQCCIHTVDAGTGGSDWYPGHCVTVTAASNPCVYCGDTSCLIVNTGTDRYLGPELNTHCQHRYWRE